jgi:hypothetical protein
MTRSCGQSKKFFFFNQMQVFVGPVRSANKIIGLCEKHCLDSTPDGCEKGCGWR